MRSITSLIFIAIAGVLFFGFTTNLFSDIDALRIEKVQAKEDLQDTMDLQAQFQALQAQSDGIGDAQLSQLKSLLPDSIDTVDLLHKINGIAAKAKVQLTNAQIKIEEPGRSSRASKTNQIAGLGTATFNMTLTGNYPAFQSFLADLERNLRLVDISVISFNSVDGGLYQYNVALKTYWLK